MIIDITMARDLSFFSSIRCENTALVLNSSVTFVPGPLQLGVVSLYVITSSCPALIFNTGHIRILLKITIFKTCFSASIEDQKIGIESTFHKSTFSMADIRVYYRKGVNF